MKAIILKGFGGVEQFELKEIEQPQPRNNEVLIRIRATAFNPIDYQMRQGGPESKLLTSPVLGRELSGEVAALGKDVQSFKVGDRVSAYVGSMASNGTYAEYITVQEGLVAKNPALLNFEEATAIPLAGMTALQCFKRLNIPKEKPIFIAGGAGGVGTILIKLLLANGNKLLYTTAGNSESIAHLKSIGLDEERIFNYKNDNWVEGLRSQSGYADFEYAIDLVGSHMSESCAALLDVFGTYVDVTNLATVQAKDKLFSKAATIVNIANYAPALQAGAEKFRYYGKALKELFNQIENNVISASPIHVVGTFSVATVRKAHQLMEDNQANGRKLVMTIH